MPVSWTHSDRYISRSQKCSGGKADFIKSDRNSRKKEPCQRQEEQNQTIVWKMDSRMQAETIGIEHETDGVDDAKEKLFDSSDHIVPATRTNPRRRLVYRIEAKRSPQNQDGDTQ